MFTPFRLKKTIGEAYSMDLEDSLNTKKALARLGHLEEPEDGFDEYPDRPMIEAVRSFQRANSLVEDGVMKPDGPTIARLNESLVATPKPSPWPRGSIIPDPRKDISPPFMPITLTRPVRASSNADLADTGRVKSALERLGLPLPQGARDPYPTQDLFKNIRAFQQREGLSVDGEMLPGGETEARMNELLQKKARASQTRTSTRPQSGTMTEPNNPIEHHLPGRSVPPSVSMDEQGNWYGADGKSVDATHPLLHRAAFPAVTPYAAPVLLGGLVAAGVLTQAQSEQIQQALKAGGEKAAEALEMITGKLDGTAPSTPLGQLALLHKMLGHGLSGTAGRTEITSPMPPLPGYEPAPEEFRKPQKTEFPAEIIEVPDIAGPVPEVKAPSIFITPIPKPGEFGPQIVESKGGPRTRRQIDELRDRFLEANPDCTHVGGGRRQSDGKEVKEFYTAGVGRAFPRPGKDVGDGRQGSARLDLSFRCGDEKTYVHFQTVDVDKAGNVKQHEWKNTLRAWQNLNERRHDGEIHHIHLVPKYWMLR